MSKYPRLRWLLLLWFATIVAGVVETGSVLDALQSARVQTPGIVSLLLLALRVAAAFDAKEEDKFVHTMDGGRNVKRSGLWERVW